MYEDKEYQQVELGAILSEGLSPDTVERWPLVHLPESLAIVARASLMEDPEDRFALEDLEYAQRVVRGLRTSWGCIIAEFSGSSSEATIMVRVSGYLNSDPFLQLPHLRRDAEEVGLFLSDLANAELASRSNRHLMKCGLDWIEPGAAP